MAPPRTACPGRIIAHRGASAVAPENTLAAFRAAHAQGVRWIEFDVSQLGDGTPVVHHDASLGRCTTGHWSLSRLAADALTGIDAGGWFGPQFVGEPLPTLEATLSLMGELGLSANLEIKQHDAAPDACARAVCAALARHEWAPARVIVSSFDLPALEAFRRSAPAQSVAVLYEDPPEDWPAVLERLDAAALHMDWHSLTTAHLETALRTGRDLRVYTLNDPDRLQPAPGLTGVITDHPPAFLDHPAWRDWAAA